jgi:hypothetical protein
MRIKREHQSETNTKTVDSTTGKTDIPDTTLSQCGTHSDDVKEEEANEDGRKALQSDFNVAGKEDALEKAVPTERAIDGLAGDGSTKSKRGERRHSNGDVQVPKHQLVCGNCSLTGHSVEECSRNLDSEGFVNACPLCNTNRHNAMHCPVLLTMNLSQLYHYFVRCRQGRPPLRGPWNFWEVYPAKWDQDANRLRLQTASFAQDRANRVGWQQLDELVIDPIWKHKDWREIIEVQIHSADRARTGLFNFPALPSLNSEAQTQATLNVSRDPQPSQCGADTNVSERTENVNPRPADTKQRSPRSGHLD